MNASYKIEQHAKEWLPPMSKIEQTYGDGKRD